MAEGQLPLRRSRSPSHSAPASPIGTPVTKSLPGVIRVSSEGSLGTFLESQMVDPGHVSAPSSRGSSAVPASLPTPPRRRDEGAQSDAESAATAPIFPSRRTPPRRGGGPWSGATRSTARSAGLPTPPRPRPARSGLVEQLGTAAYYTTKYGLFAPGRPKGRFNVPST